MSNDQALYSGICERAHNGFPACWICGNCGEANLIDDDFPDAVEGHCEHCDAKNTLEEA